MFVAIAVTVLWVLQLCLHEFSHALVAFIGGDDSVHERGYLSLNPLKYIDPGLSIVLPTVILLLGGLALPGGAVLINHQKLRHRFWASLVAIAGPVATILFVVVCAQLAQAPVSHELQESLAFLAYLCAGVAILNLLPVPPLDGYGIWEPWLPIALRQKLAPLNRFGFWIIFAVLWFVPFASDILWGSAAAIAMLLGVNPELIQEGQNTFRRSAQPLGIGLIVIAIIANQIKGKGKPAN